VVGSRGSALDKIYRRIALEGQGPALAHTRRKKLEIP
jgi:hypothetical protein